MFLMNGKIFSKKILLCLMCLVILNVKASTNACGVNYGNPVVSQSEVDIQNPDAKQELDLLSLKMKNERKDQDTQSKVPLKNDKRKFVFVLSNETISEDLQKLQNSSVEIKPDTQNWNGEWFLYEKDEFKDITSRLKASIENIQINYELYCKKLDDVKSRSRIKCPEQPIKFSELEKPNTKLFIDITKHSYFSKIKMEDIWKFDASVGLIQNTFYNNKFYASDACQYLMTRVSTADLWCYNYNLSIPKDMNNLKILFIPYLALFNYNSASVYLLILNKKQGIVGHGTIFIDKIE